MAGTVRLRVESGKGQRIRRSYKSGPLTSWDDNRKIKYYDLELPLARSTQAARPRAAPLHSASSRVCTEESQELLPRHQCS